MNSSKIKILNLFLLLIYTGICIANDEDDDLMLDYLTKNNFLQGKAEIVFLLDRSGSVGSTNFEIEKGFVESFLTHVVVDVNASRVAVISYSNTAERHIDYLSNPKSKCFLSQELQDVRFKDSGATNIAAAFDEAREVLKNARPNVNKVVILISDGFATMGGDPVPHANKLKEDGVQLFSFGIGQYLKTELLYLASSTQHVYTCSEFRQFKRLARKIRGDPHEASWTGQESTPKCDHLCDSPYKGEPGDPGCCDHDARCSCALLSGMHTCVCGPGYYGLSGLMGDCRACPRGTYKSTLEPSRSCTSCPAGATTADVASTSIKDCYCKEGYHGDPSKEIPCTKVKCPLLQAPTHGHVLGECDTTYGSTCIFMCEEGYELQDPSSDLRSCESNGQWSGKTAVCKKIRCNALQTPKFGFKYCTSTELFVGQKCYFQCIKGFIQEGSNERECLSTKNWSGTESKCFAKECSIPPPLTHGRHTCSTHKKMTFGEACLYTCNNGFELIGPRVIHCNENGTLEFEQNEHRRPRCDDITEPEIKCPRTIKVAAEKGKNVATVKWKVPQPTDNSGITPKLIIKPPNISPPSSFPIGVNNFEYMAKDHADLKSLCTVTIVVLDKEPPRVMQCPQRIEASTSEATAVVEWNEPIFEDNSKSEIQIFKTAKSGDKFGIGSHHVTYQAIDSSGNSAYCIFDIFVSRTLCPYYPAPVNGALACDDWMNGQLCQVYCNEKYDFVSKPAEWYVCSSEAKWITDPEDMLIPWPDCAKPAIPGVVRQMMKGFYYSGNCSDPAVQLRLKNIFLNHVAKKLDGSELCAKKNACSIKTVHILCGKTTDKERKRRDVWEHAQKEKLELEFEILIDADREINDTEAVLQEFLETIKNLKWDLEDELKQELTTLAPEVDVPISDQSSNKAGTLELTEEETMIVCKPGSVLSDNLCVLCPPGTFYEPDMKECLDCPLGHYQDNEGQPSCEKCPKGTSTEHRRTRNQTDCKEICLSGTYSPTGLATCLACPVGTYQEHVGQKSCSACPNETTTTGVQSASSEECRSSCMPGFFSENGLQPCKLCPKSFYQPLFAQTFCLECPINFTTVDEGATDHSHCLDLDPCLNGSWCLNDGYCERIDRNALCFCREGFEGDRCEVDINECLQNPCYNDAVCVNNIGSYMCKCDDGFLGALCEEEIDECISFPCMNNGTCLDKINNYTCVCTKGFEGRNCEVVQEICFHDVICLNGAVCVHPEGNSTSFCECEPGYGGVDCSVNIDECENVTCHNKGSCTDGIASFKCECSVGYNGTFCEIDIDECENNLCRSGSTCKDLVGRYECLCPPGWNGTTCENKMDSDFIFMFPESTATIANMASTKLQSPLSDATISLWVQTTDTEHSGTPLSYAVASTSTTDAEGNVIDNALTISDCSGVQIYVNNEPVVSDLQVADGEWHHLAFAWSSENSGTWTLYKDGQLQAQGDNLRPHDIISGGGTMIIGQEQDTVGGGFSPLETFTGNITRVNIWNSYFSKTNITRLCKMDDDIPGKVIAWPDFLAGVRGDIRIIKNERLLLSQTSK